MSMFGSVFNPYPIQAAMGLLDDASAPPAHSRTMACFDQRQVPTHMLVGGTLMERVIGQDGNGRAGAFIEQSIEFMRERYGSAGEFAAREWMAQEYLWNRWGANFGDVSDRMPALWEEVGSAVKEGEPRLMLAAGVAHYTAIYLETQLPITHRTWSCWYHSKHPWQGLDPFEHRPPLDEDGYPVWATDELPASPDDIDILQSPFVWEPFILKGRNKTTAGTTLLVEPTIV